MLTRLLHLKRKEHTRAQTNKNCLRRQENPHSPPGLYRLCMFRYVEKCGFAWMIPIHCSPPGISNKHVLYLHRRWMLLVFKDVIWGYVEWKLKNFQKFVSRAHSSFSSGEVVGKVKRQISIAALSWVVRWKVKCWQEKQTVLDRNVFVSSPLSSLYSLCNFWQGVTF